MYFISGRAAISSRVAPPNRFSTRICVGVFQAPATRVAAARAAIFASSTVSTIEEPKKPHPWGIATPSFWSAST